MEMINLDYLKHDSVKTNYVSDLKTYLINNGLNFNESEFTQYNYCYALFSSMDLQLDKLINEHHRVTLSSNNWKNALLLLPIKQPNHISCLISVIQEDHQLVKALKIPQSGDFFFLIVKNQDDHLTFVLVYLSLKMFCQSQVSVTYQEQVCRLNDASKKQFFPQNEVNLGKLLSDNNENQNGIQSQKCLDDTQNIVGNKEEVTQDHNFRYLVNYRNEREYIHGKRITDIVEYALKEMDVPQGKINSKEVYDQIIDNMTSRLGHPLPHLANYENIQENESYVPYDLRNLLPKSSLLLHLFGSDNKVDIRICQEQSREEVLFTASKEGQCLDIGVVYLKIDTEKVKSKGLIWASTKVKKNLYFKKLTFSMSRNEINSITSRLKHL